MLAEEKVRRRLSSSLPQNPNFAHPFYIRVSENTSNFVLLKCFDYLKASCFSRHVENFFNNLDKKESSTDLTRGCYPELLSCETNFPNCSIKAKNHALENRFSPYTNLLVSDTQVEGTNDRLISEVGTWVAKATNKVTDLGENISEKVVKGVEVVKEKLERNN